MSNIPERWDGENQWYFVTIVTKDRKPILADEQACIALQRAFHKSHPYYPFRLAALVILPDHWLGLIRPDKSKVIEQVVGAVKRNVLNDLEYKKSLDVIFFIQIVSRLTMSLFISFNKEICYGKRSL